MERKSEKGDGKQKQTLSNHEPEIVEAKAPEQTPAARRDVESIRIYADSNVCALFAEVEEEISRMSRITTADVRDDPDAEGQNEKEKRPKDSPEKMETTRKGKEMEKQFLLPVQDPINEADEDVYLDSRQYVP